jgi:hypothetical protein
MKDTAEDHKSTILENCQTLRRIAAYFNHFNTVILVCNMYYVLSKERDLSQSTYKLRMQL